MSGIMAALAGGGGLSGSASIPDLNPNDFQINITANAVLSLLNTGAYTSTNQSGGNYCSPTSIASLLEARLTKNSGTGNPTGSAMATWLNLGTTRTWTVSSPVAGLIEAVCTLEIREAGTGTILDTSTITFSADSESI